jgi:hypothetical protein
VDPQPSSPQDARSAWPPSDPLGGLRREDAVLTIPAIRVAFVLSLLLHAAVLWGWVPRPLDPISDRIGRGKGSGPLAVRLAPPPSPATPIASAPPVSPSPPPPAAKRPPPPPAAPRPRPAPPPVAKAAPAPAVAPVPAPPPSAAAAPAPAPLDLDFSAALEARRRARGATPEQSAPSTAPAEDERARHSRIVAENLGLNRVPTYGREPTGGGIFQLERVGYTDAEFLFFGWNKDIRRRSRQLIVVERGANPSIEIAIVRRMIGIIREHESGDFVWRSTRLGREVTLSARAPDNAGLEDFLMHEFFPERRPG